MGQWQPYIIAIVIGLLVGIEREKAHPDQKAMGVRTFLLISLLGAIAGDLQHLWLSILLTAFALSLVVISYFTQSTSKASKFDRGLTTEFAAGLVFSFGFIAHRSPALSAMLGPLVAMILFSKKTLHRFTHAIRPAELEAALLILLAGVVVIDFTPDRIIDPWGVFNPRKFGYLVLTLAVLEFLSYVLAKSIGDTKGSLIVGFCGGFVSSTAVLLSSARQANKNPENWRALLSSTLVAKIAALVELLLIVGLVSPPFLYRVALPPVLAIIVCIGALVLIARKKFDQKSGLNLRSPLDWRGVLRLSLTLGAILALISLTKHWLGDQATFAISFLTGLFELHGVSLATATMYDNGNLNIDVACKSILFATVASLTAKISISWIINRGTFAVLLTTIFLTMIAIIVSAGFVTFSW